MTVPLHVSRSAINSEVVMFFFLVFLFVDSTSFPYAENSGEFSKYLLFLWAGWRRGLPHAKGCLIESGSTHLLPRQLICADLTKALNHPGSSARAVTTTYLDSRRGAIYLSKVKGAGYWLALTNFDPWTIAHIALSVSASNHLRQGPKIYKFRQILWRCGLIMMIDCKYW